MADLLGLLLLVSIAGVLLVLLLAAIVAREARRPPRRTAGYALARGLAVDPGELGLAFESWTLECPGKAVLPVWEIEPGGRRGDEATRLTVVFIHGWGQSRIDMLARIEPWKELVDRLVLYDLRGHGDAEGISDLGCREELDLLHLLERLGTGRHLLVGCSMGAVIAMAAAARPEPVAGSIRGVVAYGPYRDFHTSMRARLRWRGLPARPMSDLAMLWFGLRGLRHHPSECHARRLRCPLLVIHGGEDPVCPRADAQHLVEVAPAATLVEVDGAFHLDAHQVHPELHDQAIRRFVERVKV